tara:strand:+ start:18 stop:386 length:369 start_codon:yes stop_codon:yes gene_type:complete
MADGGGVGGKDLCSDVLNINGIAMANIAKIDGKSKKSCATCTGFLIAQDASCVAACASTRCSTQYTDGTVGSLTPGDKLFSDSGCSSVLGAGYYSDNRCGGSQRSCFTVGAGGIITRIDVCR